MFFVNAKGARDKYHGEHEARNCKRIFLMELFFFYLLCFIKQYWHDTFNNDSVFMNEITSLIPSGSSKLITLGVALNKGQCKKVKCFVKYIFLNEQLHRNRTGNTVS